MRRERVYMSLTSQSSMSYLPSNWVRMASNGTNLWHFKMCHQNKQKSDIQKFQILSRLLTIWPSVRPNLTCPLTMVSTLSMVLFCACWRKNRLDILMTSAPSETKHKGGPSNFCSVGSSNVSRPWGKASTGKIEDLVWYVIGQIKVGAIQEIWLEYRYSLRNFS